jgi:phosphoribosylformylglycinamidine synthase
VVIAGVTGGDLLTLPGDETISVADLKAAHESWLPDYMAAEPA